MNSVACRCSENCRPAIRALCILDLITGWQPSLRSHGCQSQLSLTSWRRRNTVHTHMQQVKQFFGFLGFPNPNPIDWASTMPLSVCNVLVMVHDIFKAIMGLVEPIKYIPGYLSLHVVCSVGKRIYRNSQTQYHRGLATSWTRSKSTICKR